MLNAQPSPPRRRPGRPPLRRNAPLARDEIVDRALEIVREEGRDALSMRRLAKELDVTPMALYHHVSDKPALLDAMVERVWAEIVGRTPRHPGDPIEFLVAVCVTTRQVWLEHFDLAALAVAVFEADDVLFATTRFHASLFEAAGFPDVPLAYNAVQTFTMGSVQIAANRRTASGFFGRDPDNVLSRARGLFARNGASENHRGVLEARFDQGDASAFEPALRALIAGLLAGSGGTAGHSS